MIDEPEALSNAPNSPELDGTYLGTITADFARVADFIQETSHQIRQRGFSQHPVFIVSKQSQPIGTLLLGPGEMNENRWYYAASFLEDFRQRELVGEDGEALFRDTYKDPGEYACLFVVDADFTRFIFIPYPEE